MKAADSSVPGEQEARTLLRNKDFAGAIRLLQKLLDDHPREHDLLELLGLAQFYSKDLAAARATFERLTREASSRIGAWVNLGAVLNRMGEFRKALEALRRAVQKDRRCAEAYYNMGIAQRGLSMNTMAIAAYREAIRADPTMVDAHLNLGNLFVEMKNMGQAVQCFQQAIKQSPDHPRAIAALENATSAQKRIRRAESPFGRLVDVSKLDQKQPGSSGPRVLEVAARNEERDLVQKLTKGIRQAAKSLVPLLDDSLHQQLHQLQIAAIQGDPRMEGAGVHTQLRETMQAIRDVRTQMSEAFGELRTHVQQSHQ